MFITTDFFRNCLYQMIDLRHQLAVLANRMPWQEIEASPAHLFALQVLPSKKIEDTDLFGATEMMCEKKEQPQATPPDGCSEPLS